MLVFNVSKIIMSHHVIPEERWRKLKKHSSFCGDWETLFKNTIHKAWMINHSPQVRSWDLKLKGLGERRCDFEMTGLGGCRLSKPTQHSESLYLLNVTKKGFFSNLLCVLQLGKRRTGRNIIVIIWIYNTLLDVCVSSVEGFPLISILSATYSCHKNIDRVSICLQNNTTLKIRLMSDTYCPKKKLLTAFHGHTGKKVVNQLFLNKSSAPFGSCWCNIHTVHTYLPGPFGIATSRVFSTFLMSNFLHQLTRALCLMDFTAGAFCLCVHVIRQVVVKHGWH